jgi:hypothetical protein
MKNLIFLSICLFLVACQLETKEVEKEKPTKIITKQIESKPTKYAYNEIIHYHFILGSDTLFTDEVLQDSISNKLLFERRKLTLNDTTGFREAERIGYITSEISNTDFPLINRIFRNFVYETSSNLCIKTYRDILVFKKDNRTIGFIKLCFECHDAILISKDGLERLNLSGRNYEQLIELLQ